jgi:hypothetical protein
MSLGKKMYTTGKESSGFRTQRKLKSNTHMNGFYQKFRTVDSHRFDTFENSKARNKSGEIEIVDHERLDTKESTKLANQAAFKSPQNFDIFHKLSEL